MNCKNQTGNKRIVIKIGTSSLSHGTGKLNYRHIEKMVDVMCDLKNMGYEIVLISSGAVGVGFGKIRDKFALNRKPDGSAKKRALAATGQSGLMAVYEELFGLYSCRVAQVLLTKSVIQDENGLTNIVNAFNEMFEYDILPIVNENDVVAADREETDDLFGDNDTLSAYVAGFVNADLLIIWSDIDGLYDKDPRMHPDAEIIPVVTNVSDEIYAMAGGEVHSRTSRGSGGMITKIDAAGIATNAGIDMVIMNSDRPEEIYELLKGKSIGTRFKASINSI